MKTEKIIVTMLFLFVLIPFIDVSGKNCLTENTDRCSHSITSGEINDLPILNQMNDTPEYVKQQKKTMTEKGWTLKIEKSYSAQTSGIWQSNLFNAKSGKRYTAQIVSGSSSIKEAEFAVAPQGHEASSIQKSNGGFPGAITYAAGVESSSGNLVFWWKVTCSTLTVPVTILIWEK